MGFFREVLGFFIYIVVSELFGVILELVRDAEVWILFLFVSIIGCGLIRFWVILTYIKF